MGISVVQSLGNEGSASSATVVMTDSPTIGQPIIGCVPYTPTQPLSVVDNENGTCAQIGAYTGSAWVYWVIAQSTTPPTWTITMNGTRSYKLEVTILNGFLGTPTLDTGLTAEWSNGGGTTTVDFTPISSNFNNEILFMSCAGPYDIQQANGPTGWTTTGLGTAYNGDSFYAILAAAGTASNFVATLPNSGTLTGLLVGIYDAPTSSSATPSAGGVALGGQVPGVTPAQSDVITPLRARGRVPPELLARQWRRNHRGGLLVPR
jgi:hypothetical protein